MRAATNADREDGRSRIAGSERRRRDEETLRGVPGAFSATFSADTSIVSSAFLLSPSHAGILSGNIARGRFGSTSRLEAGSSPPRGRGGRGRYARMFRAGWGGGTVGSRRETAACAFRRRGEYRVSRLKSVAGAAANFVRPLRGYGGHRVGMFRSLISGAQRSVRLSSAHRHRKQRGSAGSAAGPCVS